LGWGGGLGGEMNQALYVHMNNKRKMKKKNLTSFFILQSLSSFLPFKVSFFRLALSHVFLNLS
jgi:hypothetical protein